MEYIARNKETLEGRKEKEKEEWRSLADEGESAWVGMWRPRAQALLSKVSTALPVARRTSCEVCSLNICVVFETLLFRISSHVYFGDSLFENRKMWTRSVCTSLFFPSSLSNRVKQRLSCVFGDLVEYLQICERIYLYIRVVYIGASPAGLTFPRYG